MSLKHIRYNAAQSKDDLAYHMTAHLRLNAIYWGLMALCTMDHGDALDRDEVIEFVMSCWDEEQGPLVCDFPRFDVRSNESTHRCIWGAPRS
jgi:prenyltransferase beta subunit